jgi:hypothetical protein
MVGPPVLEQLLDSCLMAQRPEQNFGEIDNYGNKSVKSIKQLKNIQSVGVNHLTHFNKGLQLVLA